MEKSEPSIRRIAAPRAADFRAQLRQDLQAATSRNKDFLDVVARQLHQMVGGYPSAHNRMVVCCKVMLSEMTADDEVLKAPPSRLGASLVIRYTLPRPPA